MRVQRGFTLLETLLSIAALGIIAGISIPLYQSFRVRNDVDIAAVTITQSLRRAQVLARASSGDAHWGVAIATSSITLYKGPSYAGRDTSYDEMFDLPASITPSGLTEITFTKFTGLPESAGTTTLTSSTNEVRTISLNEQGTVNY